MLLELVLNELKTETVASIRKEVVKVMGIVGALDPYEHRVNEVDLYKV